MAGHSQPGGVFHPALIRAARSRRDVLIIVAVWLALAGILLCLARQNLAEPGAYYDETNYGGLAKDFLAGKSPHGEHWNAWIGFPYSVQVFGRPFPVFIASYMGAVKSWLLILTFSIFGPSLTVIRLTSLTCGLLALLVFMLWVRRWLGRNAAVVFGLLVAFDPSFFFGTLIDWGGISPSILCKACCFYCTVSWWRKPHYGYAALAGAFAGLGFFHKIDIAIPFGAAAVAAAIAYARPLLARLAAKRWTLAVAAGGFLVPASVMLLNLPRVFSTRMPIGPTDPNEKIGTLFAMYDGSYYYRLMDFGGIFYRIFSWSAPIFVPLGIILALAGLYLLSCILTGRLGTRHKRGAVFLCLSTLLVTLGVLILPAATRLHHAMVVFPFSHLLIASGMAMFYRRFSKPQIGYKLARLLPVAGLMVILATQAHAIHKTEQLIHATGGRGWWSDSMADFCKSVKCRKDLTIASLDWGFNEQLLFSTDGPKLVEPFWANPDALPPGMPKPTNWVFLVHPDYYTFFRCGTELLKDAQARPEDVEIKPYCDRQGQVAFYSIRYMK